MTFQFLYTFGGADMQFMPRIGEYWDFYSWFLLGLGLVFQIPVVIFVLARLGLVTPMGLLRVWKWAVLGSFIVSAVVTPSPDVVNQTALAAPMIGLYLLGVLVAWVFGRKRRGPKDRLTELHGPLELRLRSEPERSQRQASGLLRGRLRRGRGLRRPEGRVLLPRLRGDEALAGIQPVAGSSPVLERGVARSTCRASCARRTLRPFNVASPSAAALSKSAKPACEENTR